RLDRRCAGLPAHHSDYFQARPSRSATTPAARRGPDGPCAVLAAPHCVGISGPVAAIGSLADFFKLGGLGLTQPARFAPDANRRSADLLKLADAMHRSSARTCYAVSCTWLRNSSGNPGSSADRVKLSMF